MTRTLTFGPCTDPATKQPSACCKRFTLLVTLFISGGNVLYFNPQSGQVTRPRDERAKEARITRAWKAISREDEKGIRFLKPEGGSLVLDQKDYELLLRYIIASPGGTQDADVIDELIDWVSAIPVDPESKPSAPSAPSV